MNFNCNYWIQKLCKHFFLQNIACPKKIKSINDHYLIQYKLTMNKITDFLIWISHVFQFTVRLPGCDAGFQSGRRQMLPQVSAAAQNNQEQREPAAFIRQEEPPSPWRPKRRVRRLAVKKIARPGWHYVSHVWKCNQFFWPFLLQIVFMGWKLKP